MYISPRDDSTQVLPTLSCCKISPPYDFDYLKPKYVLQDHVLQEAIKLLANKVESLKTVDFYQFHIAKIS